MTRRVTFTERPSSPPRQVSRYRCAFATSLAGAGLSKSSPVNSASAVASNRLCKRSKYPGDGSARRAVGPTGRGVRPWDAAALLHDDAGQVFLDGNEVHFKTPQDARSAGIETVYQTLAVAPALDIVLLQPA